MNWLTDKRFLFFLVVVVLVGSLVGANTMMKARHDAPGRNAAGGADKAVAENAQRVPAGVVATGIYAPERMPVKLAPSVKGEVVEVLVKDDEKVKKGQLLLRMDDKPYRVKVERAAEGVALAEQLAEKAKRGMKEWEVGINRLKLKVKAADKDYERAHNLQATLKKQIDSKLSVAGIEDQYKDAYLQAEKALIGIDAAKEELKEAEIKKPTIEAMQAEIAVKEANLQLKEAKIFLDFCELRAPGDGTIMQSFVAPGVKFGEQAVMPAFIFYVGEPVVKADINQEWAHKVKEGMTAMVEDAGGSGLKWKGKVYYVAKSFLPKRDAAGALEGVNLLQQNQELVLECRIQLDPEQPAPFLNQKVRVHIGQ